MTRRIQPMLFKTTRLAALDPSHVLPSKRRISIVIIMAGAPVLLLENLDLKRMAIGIKNHVPIVAGPLLTSASLVLIGHENRLASLTQLSMIESKTQHMINKRILRPLRRGIEEAIIMTGGGVDRLENPVLVAIGRRRDPIGTTVILRNLAWLHRAIKQHILTTAGDEDRSENPDPPKKGSNRWQSSGSFRITNIA
jgi:hypothetical protein